MSILDSKTMIGPFAMVISNGVAQNSADVFNILDRDGGGKATFSIPLSASGTGSPTHWAAYSQLEERTHHALTVLGVQEFKAFVDAMAVEKQRTPVGSITAFKGSIQIGEAGGDPWAFLASLGLKRIEVTPLSTGPGQAL